MTRTKGFKIQKTSPKVGPNAPSETFLKTIIETKGSFWNQKFGQH
jgi:hypothetical protein